MARIIVWSGVLIGVCLFAAVAGAQTAPPKNPSEVAFTCPDHAADTDHEVGFFLAGATAPVQAQRVGDPAVNADGSVHAAINSRPLGIGAYELKVRIYAGTTASAWGAGGPDGQTPVPFERALLPPVDLRVVR